MACFAPVNIALGLHWHHFNQTLLPPLIEPHAAKPPIPNKVLVYMGFEQQQDIIDFLLPFTHVDFYVFVRDGVSQNLGHIHIRPVSHAEFHAHLEDCSGVISNAGFELASECLALGKKLLVKPLSGQYEQLSNALALQALGRGTVLQSLDSAALEQWLLLPSHRPIPYPDVSKALALWLKGGCEQSASEFATSLWSSFNLGYDVDMNFGSGIVPNRIV